MVMLGLWIDISGVGEGKLWNCLNGNLETKEGKSFLKKEAVDSVTCCGVKRASPEKTLWI